MYASALQPGGPKKGGSEGRGPVRSAERAVRSVIRPKLRAEPVSSLKTCEGTTTRPPLDPRSHDWSSAAPKHPLSGKASKRAEACLKGASASPAQRRTFNGTPILERWASPFSARTVLISYINLNVNSKLTLVQDSTSPTLDMSEEHSAPTASESSLATQAQTTPLISKDSAFATYTKEMKRIQAAIARLDKTVTDRANSRRILESTTQPADFPTISECQTDLATLQQAVKEAFSEASATITKRSELLQKSRFLREQIQESVRTLKWRLKELDACEKVLDRPVPKKGATEAWTNGHTDALTRLENL